MTSPGIRNAALCFSVTGLVFVACLLYLRLSPPVAPLNDAVEYYTLACNLSAGKGFSMDGVTPYMYRPPLYSVLLGGWFYLTGSTSLYSAALFQSLVHSLSCGAAFFLFLGVFGSACWALFLSLWLGLPPPFLSRIGFVLQEPTLILFTTLALLASLKFLQRRTSPAAFSAGIAWGLCTLAKSVAWIGVLLMVLERLLNRSAAGSRRQAAILVFAFLAAMSPWVVRNYADFGRLIIVNSQGTGMMEWNFTVAYKRSLFNKNLDIVSSKRLLSEMNAKSLSDSEKREGMRSLAKKNFAYYFFGRVLSGALYFTFPDFFQNWYATKLAPPPGLRKVIAYAWWLFLTLPLYLALLWRCFQLVKRRLTAPASFLVVFYLLYWAQYAALWGDPRFSVPVYPVLLCLLPVPFLRTGSGSKDGLLRISSSPNTAGGVQT
jgi:hypothetical protein